ncbi:MAG: hypothetical protein WBF13_02190 [Candidatus Zixiibacteriota bacterium]
MKQKRRIKKLEQEIAPEQFTIIKIISHIPGAPPVQRFRVSKGRGGEAKWTEIEPDEHADQADQPLMSEKASRALPDEG